jgi:hypothetical protein
LDGWVRRGRGRGVVGRTSVVVNAINTFHSETNIYGEGRTSMVVKIRRVVRKGPPNIIAFEWKHICIPTVRCLFAVYISALV